MRVVSAAEVQEQAARTLDLEPRAKANKTWIWLAIGVAAAVLVCWAVLRTAGGRTDEASAVEVMPLVSMPEGRVDQRFHLTVTRWPLPLDTRQNVLRFTSR